MSITQWLKVASVVLILGATGSGAGLLAHSAGSDDQPRPKASATVPRADDVPVHVTLPGKLRVTAVEKGVVESSSNYDAYCLVEGQTTLIKILPEGSAVKKGQIVCELDSAALRDRLVNQKITTKTAEANQMIQDWLKEDPTSADPIVADAWRLRREKNLPMAQARLEEALARDMNNRRALTEMAILWERQGNPERAYVLYERILERDPKQEAIRERLEELKAKGVKRPLPV